MPEIGGKPTVYETRRRVVHQTTGQPLSAFALDWTIRLGKDGAGYLDDANFPDNPLVFNDLPELRGFITAELERHYTEHFGAPPEAA